MLHNRLSSVLSTLTVLLITACNADVPAASDERSGTSGTSFQEAVTFGVSEVQAVSRTGFVGELDELFMRATGFGVYAYVTSDGGTWASAGSTATPDFMTNEHVSYEPNDGWTYRPLKYWPNEAADGTIDRVSFFAYAPYVDLSDVAYHDATAAMIAAAAPAFTGEGILSLPIAATAGTPKIAYSVASRPAFSVDLMYGVAAPPQEGTVVSAGMPFLDMTKEAVFDRIDYRFCHALTRVVAFADVIDNVEEPVDFLNTKLVISGIVLGGGQVLYKRGVLNLQNTEANAPKWEDKDGMVGDMTDYMATTMLHTDAGKSTDTYFAHQPLGVSTTEQSLFGLGVDGRTAAALLFIAGEANADEPRVWPLLTVTYHIIRRDGSEPYGYTDTEVTREVTLKNVEFKPSETTVLRLHFDFNEKNPTLIVDSDKYTEQW